MQKGEARKIFLHACAETGAELAGRGFLPVRGGQAWKKQAGGGELTFSVHFQSSHYNGEGLIAILPQLSVVSKRAKRVEELHGFPHPSGLVWELPLGYLTAREAAGEWNLAGASYPHAVREMRGLLARRALPVFARFEAPKEAAVFLSEHGCLFHEEMRPQHDTLSALAFLLAYGTADEAQRYLNGYVARSRAKGRFYAFFSQLERGEAGDAFAESAYAALAYACGLRLDPPGFNRAGKSASGQ